MIQQPRVIQCRHCGHSDKAEVFYYGRGRQYGEHPDHRFCPRCHGSIDWFGYSVVQPRGRERQLLQV